VRILFVGVFKENSTNLAQVRELQKDNIVNCFDYRDSLEVLGTEGAVSSIIALSKEVDLTIFSKCNKLPVSAVTQCKSKKLLWYMDPMHNFDKELADKIIASDYVCCALYEPYKAALALNENSYFVHEGFDSDIFKKETWVKDIDVSFIGSIYGDREEFLKKTEKVTIMDNVFGRKHNEIVCRSKINLNFTEGGCSDRVYKVFAAGGFLLTQPWPKMLDDFPLLHVCTFDSPEKMNDRIHFFLNNDKTREEIAEQCYKQVQKFTVNNWAKRIIEIVN